MSDTENEQNKSGEQEQNEELQEQQGGSENDPKEGEPKGESSEDPQEVASLPEWAQKIITETRREAAARRTALNESNEKLSKAKTPEEFEAATQEFGDKIQTLEHELLMRDVASGAGLPKDLAEVLKGTNREELEAHAEVLKRYATKAPKQRDVGELNGGLNGSNEGDPLDNLGPRELAAKAKRKSIF